MDTVTALYPLRVAVARQWAEGFWPLWLPNQAGGYPLAANPQVGVWYPPHLLFFLWPHPITNGVILVGHVVWGGWGLYRWTRLAGIRRAPALWGAVAFQFGAVMVSRMALTPHLCSVAWIPWMLWALERAVRVRGGLDWGQSAWIALLVAMQILVGAPQVTYYTGLLLPLWWMGRGWQLYGRAGILRALGQGVVTAVLVLLLASIQLLPTTELFQQSARTSLSLEKLQQQGLGGGFVWRALVGGTGPLIEDTDSINAIGAGLLVLIPLALIRRRHRQVAWLVMSLAILFYILALGAMAPLLAPTLPLYSSFHAPRRALLMWSVLGPWLAVLGASTLWGWCRLRGWGRVGPWLLVLLLVPNLWMLPRLERQFTTLERFEPDPRMATLLGDHTFLTVDPTFRYSYDSRRPEYGRSLLPNLAAWHDLHDAQVYDPLVLRRTSRFSRAVNADSGHFYPSHGLTYSDPGHPALAQLAVQYLVGRWDLHDPGRLIPRTRVDQARLRQSLESQPRLDAVHWPLWRFREDRPVAWFPHNVMAVRGAEQAVAQAVLHDAHQTMFDERATGSGSWPPLPMSILSADDPTTSPNHAPHTSASLTVTRPGPDRFLLRFNSASRRALEQTGTRPLALASVWMPGWQARVLHGYFSGPFQPGDRLPISVLNGLLLAVDVPPGVEAIEVRYRPASFRTGAALTSLGLVLAIAFLGLGRRTVTYLRR
jgi:hypothetical protein